MFQSEGRTCQAAQARLTAVEGDGDDDSAESSSGGRGRARHAAMEEDVEAVFVSVVVVGGGRLGVFVSVATHISVCCR